MEENSERLVLVKKKIIYIFKEVGSLFTIGVDPELNNIYFLFNDQLSTKKLMRLILFLIGNLL